MPSSKNYVRNYKQEAAAESPRRQEDRAKRVAIRRAFEKANGHIPEGLDLHHKHDLGKGGSNTLANVTPIPAHKNRSYARTAKGKMK